MDTPYSLLVAEEVVSTQDLARELMRPSRPAVVVAHRQTGGRGRSGSPWQTAPRAVAVSVGFRSDWQSPYRTLLPLVAGVAARRVLGESVWLKWPNDLLVDDSKAGGILVEAAGEQIVAGMGVNLYWPDPPAGVGALDARDPGSDRGPQLATGWADELLTLMRTGADRWPRDEYLEACVTLGTQISWDPNGRGRAVDVAPDGSLEVVTAEGHRISLTAGAVRHVRPSPG
ncbi:MAG TPA: biotin--[acetyl-CoA-carboxylase] ligase [Acidimicrobiia bacterium]|nr:biotin--[acetyl-CoA-carboxylase] ligase [Acidimicrobiia bacterium]